jgi:DNA-binding transcriptional ArsR family regulator
MPTPLHQLKAEFFKSLSHPMRIRVLELLSERDRSVAEMLAATGVEASNLSQQLAVLRRSGLVSARREGSTVSYSLTSPQVAELLTVARRILTTMLADQMALLTGLPAERPQQAERPQPVAAGKAAPRARRRGASTS